MVSSSNNSSSSSSSSQWSSYFKETKAKTISAHLINYNTCLIKKSAGVDMQASSLRNAVEKVCEDIATNPSWLNGWRYN